MLLLLPIRICPRSSAAAVAVVVVVVIGPKKN
jgi:hypothetical protein